MTSQGTKLAEGSKLMTLIDDIEDDTGNRKENIQTGTDKSLNPNALAKIITETNLHNEEPGKNITRASFLIKAFLYEREPEFKRALEYMIKGWENHEGDVHFKQQRETADNTTVEGEKNFFGMMIKIAGDMEAATHALSPPASMEKDFNVLDICMAPGGFTAAVLKYNPRATCYGITLPTSKGGHAVLLKEGQAKQIMELDVTMLSELSEKPIPKTHPEYANFSYKKPFKFYKIHLIFCDGVVLRTHKRPDHRQRKSVEVTRLVTAQLILAMKRIQPGGTIIMLLHKLDTWHTANILYNFSKFAKVQTFKPQKIHATRSSFYMIAKNIDTTSKYFLIALDAWREEWYTATTGGDGLGEAIAEPSEEKVLAMLADWGESMMHLGRRIWRIQADALAKTKYAGAGGSDDSKDRRFNRQLSE